MHKLFKFKNILIGIALLGLVLLPALGAFVAQAQTTPRGTDAPVGRVLQAATCNENDAVTIQVSPATPKIGGTVKFTGTVKSECQAKVGGTGSGGSMWLYHGEYTPSNTQFEAEIANGFTIAKEFPITPQLFSPGQHLVGVKMSYCAATFGEPLCLDFLGRITITVEAAATTGDATLTGTVAQQVQVSTIREVFTLVYNAGGSGKTAAKIEFYCGNETPPVKRTQNIGQPINCDYKKEAGTYTFTATAVDASNNPIQGATFSKQITLTGNETNAVGVDTPGLGDLAFGGFELFIGWLLKLFSGALKYTILWIVGPFIEAVLSIHTYDDKFANVIYPAWEIFRNLGNIFFILSIVAIGVATVFRISGWAVKDLLVKLIVGAILINFSLSIAQSILGIADTVQNQFLPNDTGAIRQIVNHLFTTDIFSGTPGNLGGFNGILEQIMNFFLAFGSFIAFLGIAALLTVRILFLWILLMLSPLPYIAMVLPISRSMSKKWWSEFGKWAFITPVMAFMLNLTALITVQTKASNIIQSLSNTDPSKTDGVVSGVMFAFASNAIPLGFLYMTLKAATAFGSGASGFVNKAAEKGVRAAFWPAAAAGAALGGGALAAGKYAGGLAAGVGKVPLNLARLKLAEGSQARAERLAGIGDQKATFKDKAMSLVFDSGKILDAKNKRLEEWRKDAQGYRAKALEHVEKNVVSLDGRKVRKARKALENTNLDESALKDQLSLLSTKQQEQLLNQLKEDGIVDPTDPNWKDQLAEQKKVLRKDLNDRKTKIAAGEVENFRDSLLGAGGIFEQQALQLDEALASANRRGDTKQVNAINSQKAALAASKLSVEDGLKQRIDGGLDLSVGALGNLTKDLTPEQQSAINKQFESVRVASVNPEEVATMQRQYDSIDPLLKTSQYIAQRRTALGADADKVTDDELLAADKTKAQSDLDKLADLKAKSKYMAFYGQEQLRRDFTDAQSAKLPKEYDEGNNINQFKSAIARGDKYLALKTWELAEKEGDIKKLLKALEYNDDKQGLEDFMNDHFGAGGFKMDAQTMTDLKRESSKRNKAAGNLDLSEQVRFDAAAGKYIDNTPDEDVGDIKGRLNTVLDKMTGDSTLQRSLNKLNTGMVFTWDAEKKAYDVSKMFETALKGIDLKDATALKAIADTLPAVVKKQLVSKTNNILKTDADVARAREQLEAVAKAQGLRQDQIDDFYLMLQQSVQNVSAPDRMRAQEAYKRINIQSNKDQGRRVR